MKSGWTSGPLGDLFSTATGTTPSKGSAANFGGPIPFVKPPELQNGVVTSTADSLTATGATEAKILPVDSVLVSCIGILGKVGLAGVPVGFNQQINAILPRPDIANPSFIFYQAQSPKFQDQLMSRSSGTTISIVNKSKFNEINIVLPPLQEQHKIVEILDEIFEKIAELETLYSRKIAALAELKQSVLQQAFAGELI